MVEDRSWSSRLSARQMEKAQGHPPDVEDECRINIKMEEKKSVLHKIPPTFRTRRSKPHLSLIRLLVSVICEDLMIVNDN